MRILYLLTLLVFLLGLKIASVASEKSMSTVMMEKKPMDKVVFIDVGMILDDQEWLGKVSYTCIQMAISDFYASYGSHYKTRLVLHTRRYKHNDVVSAAAAAMYLIQDVKVKAIIGPLTSMETQFVINIGTKAQVPIISYTATSPMLTSQSNSYFIRATQNDFFQVQATVDLIKEYGWKEVVLLYENDSYGQGILPYMVSMLQETSARLAYQCVISSFATDDQILAELVKMKLRQTRVFIVHLSSALGSRIFLKAKDAGMLVDGFVWILTTGLSNVIESLSHDVLDSMQGVLGVRTYVSKTVELEHFRTKFSTKMKPEHLNVYGLWAYDAISAVAMAVEEAAVKSDFGFLSELNRTESSNLDALGVSEFGPKLLHTISATSFEGLAGDFRLNSKGELISMTFEIINVLGIGFRRIGFWTPETGLSRDLDATSSVAFSSSKSKLLPVIWTGNSLTVPKGWEVPTSGKKLKVAVPVRPGFPEFVKVINKTTFSGFCIEVFDAVMANLPYHVPYEFVAVTKLNGSLVSFDGLVQQVYHGEYDAVAGDVSITANRSAYIDYTLPFTQSGVVMVVPVREAKTSKAWMFLKPLTWDLWVTAVCFFVFIGFVIWVLEHRVNEDFRGPPLHQAGTTLYHSFSTIVFAQSGDVLNNLARFVTVVWIFVVFVLTQSYTASLTSMLTVQQLQPSIQNVNELIKSGSFVGFQQGTFVEGLLKQMGFSDSKLRSYRNKQELDELLSKGSNNGGVAAVFDEVPYMMLFLAKYCNKYMMVQPTYKTGGFGFVFAKGSPLVPDVSRSVLNITQGKKMSEIERKWFQKQENCGNSSSEVSSDSSLGLECFWGLFLIAGVAATLALLVFLLEFLYKHRHIWMQSDTSIWTKAKAMAKIYDEIDSSSHKFRKNQQTEKSGCHCDKDGLSVAESMPTPMSCPPSPWSVSNDQRSPSPGSSKTMYDDIDSSNSHKFRKKQQHSGKWAYHCDMDRLSVAESMVFSPISCPPSPWSFTSEQRSPSPGSKFSTELRINTDC